ncbi:MAG: flagellar biosynthesis protein FlhB [Epsilonproteobacteria bacterium]|nr:flagellar biosynthesis protein FlhB [Campylobacterota bacterium]
MADEQEKTEEATPKKLEEARKEGNVPKSQDLSNIVTLIVGVVVLTFYLKFALHKMMAFYVYFLSFISHQFSINDIISLFIKTIFEVFLLLAPIALAIMLAGVLGNVAQFGFLFTTKVLIPKFSKLNPISGLKNLFSTKKLFEGTKIILKVGIAFLVGFNLFLSWLIEIPKLELFPLMDQIKWLMDKAFILAWTMIGVFVVFAAIDFAYQRYSYKKSLRMSKQEIKDEMKNSEGNPEIKAKIRQIQMKMASQRMLQDVPKADVVVTNPTHYAVALRYVQGEDNAPKVIAKGVDHLAQKIKEIARENDIMVIENKPLARQLYADVEIGEEIPQKLYKAVIEVLAYVYKVKGKKPN